MSSFLVNANALPPLEYCDDAARACAASWASNIGLRPDLVKPAFWAGGSAVKLLLLLLRAERFDYRTFVDIGAAIYAADDDSDVGSGALAFHKLWSGPDHPVKVHAFEPSNTHLEGLLAKVIAEAEA